MSLRGVRVFLQQKERRTGMKRIFSLILTLALLLTALVGCGRPGKLVGTWSGSTDVTELDAYLDAYLKEQIEQMSQTLKDGVLKNPEETGVYVEDGDRVQLTPQGEASVSCRFTVSGDTLTLEMQQKDMALTLHLTKQ